MRNFIVAFLAGIIFAVGLAISGMTQPAKVIGFLDVFGDWDPSLAFVMGGAVLVNLVMYRLTIKRPKPLFEEDFRLPSNTHIDVRLLLGAVFFGIGWGLGGFCPGPALVSIVTGTAHVAVFLLAMVAGIYMFRGAAGAFGPRGS